MLATSEDLRFAGTEGAIANRSTKLMHHYIAWVLQLATRHRSVRKSFLEVQGMLKGPSAIFRPSVVVRVVKQAISGRSDTTALADRLRAKGGFLRNEKPFRERVALEIENRSVR